MRKHAADRGHVVTVRDAPAESFPLGKDVYVHPSNYEPPPARVLGSVHDAAHDSAPDWWACWFAEVPRTCCC